MIVNGQYELSGSSPDFGCLVPAAPGAHLPLRGHVVLIGRCDRRCQLSLPWKDVSRIHCAISIDDGQITLEDLESTNGTWMNGRRIRREVLTNGSCFIIGKHGFRAELIAHLPNAVGAYSSNESEHHTESFTGRSRDAFEQTIDITAGDRTHAPLVAMSLIAIILFFLYYLVTVP